MATSFPIHEPDVQVCVLRPVNVLGYSAHSMIARYLAMRRVPTVMGFDPMMQFIHEDDLADAMVRALEVGARGAFNVEGPGAVPLHTAWWWGSWPRKTAAANMLPVVESSQPGV